MSTSKEDVRDVKQAAADAATSYAQRVKDALSSQRAREIMIFGAGVGVGVGGTMLYAWTQQNVSIDTDAADSQLEAELEM